LKIVEIYAAIGLLFYLTLNLPVLPSDNRRILLGMNSLFSAAFWLLSFVSQPR
jgi:hypothetical protein